MANAAAVPASDSSALRYYGSLVGAWSGRFAFTITDAALLSAEPFAVKLPVRASVLIARVVGALRMSTTLRPSPDDARAYVHTTLAVSMGIVLYETREIITVLADGRSFTVSGTQRPWPRIGKGAPYEGRGEVNADADAATYFLPWYGKELVQRTQIVPKGLSLSQETIWSRGEVVLERA